MLRIGICDDEIHARDALRLSIEQFLHNGGRIIYEFSSGKSAVNWLGKHFGEMDILFLDVEMNGLTGMEAAKLIREKDRDILLVFVTGYPDYVFDGYTVQALDYLIKPVKKEKLKEVLDRAEAALEARAPKTFTVQNAEGLFRIPFSEILYFYSDKRLVKLVTSKQVYSFYGKLDMVENKLDSEFIRIHQRYLVYGKNVREMEKNSVTIGNVSLPISRALRPFAMMKLARIMLGENTV